VEPRKKVFTRHYRGEDNPSGFDLWQEIIVIDTHLPDQVDDLRKKKIQLRPFDASDD
jgi:hypothetical protein